MNKEATVSLNGQEVVIKKLPLGKYAELLLSLKQLPELLGGIDQFSNEDVIQQLPNMIATAFPELAKVVSIASGISEKQILEEMGLDELTEVIIAILDVNDIEKVVENVKKIMARKVFQDVKTPSLPKTA